MSLIDPVGVEGHAPSEIRNGFFSDKIVGVILASAALCAAVPAQKAVLRVPLRGGQCADGMSVGNIDDVIFQGAAVGVQS